MPKKTAEHKAPNYTTKIVIAVVVLLVLFMIGSCTALLMRLGDTSFTQGNVAVVPVTGVIRSQSTSGLGSEVASADDIVSWLKAAGDDARIKAVILEINSPGGSPVASDEIGQAIKDLREENITVVAWIREVGASGGYWVASATNHIVANRMSVTGSIGVIGSYFGFEEFIDDWNVTRRRFVSGEKKDIGDPFRAMSVEERAFLQDKVDTIFEIFIDEVAINRDMPRDQVAALATGEYYLGVEALTNGLIDELGGLDEAIAFIEEAEDIDAELVYYQHEPSLFEILSSIRSPQTPLESLSEQPGAEYSLR